MDRKFKLQSPTTSASRDSGGGRTVEYQTDATLYAETIDLDGQESEDGGKEQGTLRGEFRTRHRVDVTSDHRLVNHRSTSEVWDVSAAFDPEGRRRELRIQAVQYGV